jgi:hypothetical protein
MSGGELLRFGAIPDLQLGLRAYDARETMKHHPNAHD